MKKNVLCIGFSEMTEMEMYAFNGGWSWKGFFNSVGNCALSGLKWGAVVGAVAGATVGITAILIDGYTGFPALAVMTIAGAAGGAIIGGIIGGTVGAIYGAIDYVVC